MKPILKLTFFLSILFLAIGCTSECDHKQQVVNDSRPKDAITYKEMAGMFHQYDIGQRKVLNKYRKEFTGSKQDTIETISHFYQLEQIKQYIAYLEKLSKEKEIKLTGLRIFSAAYPKNYSDKKLRGRHSLIFMPATNIGKFTDVAFEPLYSGKGEPVKFTKFLNQFGSKETKQVQRASFLPTLTTTQDLLSSGLNRGKLAPPY